MFKIIALFLFNNRECFQWKLDKGKAGKSKVLNDSQAWQRNGQKDEHHLLQMFHAFAHVKLSADADDCISQNYLVD